MAFCLCVLSLGFTTGLRAEGKKIFYVHAINGNDNSLNAGQSWNNAYKSIQKAINGAVEI